MSKRLTPEELEAEIARIGKLLDESPTTVYDTMRIERDDERLERLAAVEHAQWCHWTKHFLDTLEPLLTYGHTIATMLANQGRRPDEDIEASIALRRWRRQVETPYAELSEAEKESDRTWARELLAVLEEK